MVIHFKRTPGLSPGEPMNSIPAFSRAFVNESKVLIFADGRPLPASIRFIVASPTLDNLAK